MRARGGSITPAGGAGAAGDASFAACAGQGHGTEAGRSRWVAEGAAFPARVGGVAVVEGRGVPAQAAAAMTTNTNPDENPAESAALRMRASLGIGVQYDPFVSSMQYVVSSMQRAPTR